MRKPVPKIDRPLRQHLRDDEDAALVARVWQRLDDRAPRPSRRWVTASAWAVLLLAGALVAGVVRQRVGGRQPLTLVARAGEPLGLLEATATQPIRVPLSDGSEIVLAPGSRLKTLQNGNGVIELALERGRAELEVRPGGSRRWVVDADLLSVEVVGTHFSVARDAAGDAVTVSRGVVLVRGERVPDHVQKLVAGQALRVEAVPAAASSVPASSLPSSSVPSETRLAHPARAPRPIASAAVAPTVVGLPARAPSPTQLLEEVDALRRAGRLDQATSMLQRLAFDDARSPTAAIAAFTLGRLLLDAPADPARATRAFERALHLGLPAGLSADAVSLCREALTRGSHGPASADLPHDRCR